MVAVMASIIFAMTARPMDAERLADAVDRWQYGDPARRDDLSAEAWAALLRAVLCRHGAEQMRLDADEAVRKFAAGSFVTPTPALMQGIARVLCGDLDGGDASLENALGVGEHAGAPEDFATALCERSLVAIARGDWGRAEVLAGQAAAVLRRAGIEESFATPLVCAVQARTAMRRGDIPAARRELVSAQRLRHLLTYALPYFAVQARIELARVHFALADLAGARTLMREVDELLRRRPGLGTLAGQARVLRARLAEEHGSSAAGASPRCIAARACTAQSRGVAKLSSIPARRKTASAWPASTSARPQWPPAIATSDRSHSAVAKSSGAPACSPTPRASSRDASPPSRSPQRTRAIPCMSAGVGVTKPPAANLRTASSASARICSAPRWHKTARSRAAHASADGSPGRAGSPYCQRSTASANRSASAG